MEHVVAVVPTRDRWDGAERAIRSLSQVRGLAGAVFVDHGTRPYPPSVARAWDRCEQVRASTKLWWSGAVNMGARRAFAGGASHILLANDDQRFDPGLIEALCSEGGRHSDTMIGAKVLDAEQPHRICSYGATVDWASGRLELTEAGALDDGRFAHTQETGWLPTRGVLVSRSLWGRLGGADEQRFPHYFGDVDLSLRTRALGTPVLVCGSARAWVDPKTTGLLAPHKPLSLARGLRSLASRRSWANLRDHSAFVRRHGPEGQRWAYLSHHLRRHGRRTMRQALLRSFAFRRAERILRSAARPAMLYGAGWDTSWLLGARPVVCSLLDGIVDDQCAGSPHDSGLAVIDLAEAKRRGVQTLVINCAAHEEAFAERIRRAHWSGLTVFRLYRFGLTEARPQ